MQGFKMHPDAPQIPPELGTDPDKGGDWERRNKLKVYKGVSMMVSRDFKGAASQLQDVLATFTATELLAFKDFIFYTVLSSVVAMDRQNIAAKIVKSPEVLSAIDETPHLRDFLFGYYGCDYNKFFRAFVGVMEIVKKDQFVGRHLRYITRTVRLNAYRQFLAPYKSVTVSTMAGAFGVTPEFIDEEVSSFIASGKLSCKIDQVEGVIANSPREERNEMYQDIVKQGDKLLNRMQKLSKVMGM